MERLDWEYNECNLFYMNSEHCQFLSVPADLSPMSVKKTWIITNCSPPKYQLGNIWPSLRIVQPSSKYDLSSAWTAEVMKTFEIVPGQDWFFFLRGGGGHFAHMITSPHPVVPQLASVSIGWSLISLPIIITCCMVGMLKLSGDFQGHICKT